MSRVVIAILALTSALTCGCPWKRSTRAMTHPPPKVFVPPVAPTPSRTAPVLNLKPPALTPEPAPYETTLDLPPVELPPAPHPPPRRRSPRAEAPVAQEQEPPATEEAAEPAPQLVEIFTPERRRQLEAAIDQEITRAEKSLETAERRGKLNSEQSDSASLIRSFLRQAREARNRIRLVPGAWRRERRCWLSTWRRTSGSYWVGFPVVVLALPAAGCPAPAVN
jgi:hypothetical protein